MEGTDDGKPEDAATLAYGKTNYWYNKGQTVSVLTKPDFGCVMFGAKTTD